LSHYADFPEPTDEAIDEIHEVFSEVMHQCIRDRAPTNMADVPRRLIDFLTTASSGLAGVRFKAKVGITTKVFDINRSLFLRRSVEIDVSSRSKLLAYLLNKELAHKSSEVTHEKPASLGFRHVVGGRPTRIIFPIPLPRYLVQHLAVEPLTEVILRGRSIESNSLFAYSGIGLEYGVPHQSLAHILHYSGLGTHLIIAEDYTMFDASQTGKVATAEHEGARRGILSHLVYGVRTTEENKKRDNWLSLTYIEKYELGMYPDGGFARFTSKGKFGDFVVKTDMLASGVPYTASFNTVRNMALTTHQLKMMEQSPSVVTYANIIGDDKCVIKQMDCRNEEEFINRCEREAKACEVVATEGHVSVNTKRSVFSNTTGEHIKVGFRYGLVFPNNQLQYLFSEKTMMMDWDPFQKARTMVSNLMTGACRTVDDDAVVPFMIKILPLLTRVNTPEVRFIMGPGVLLSTEGAGMDLFCPILPRGIRLMMEDDWVKAVVSEYNDMAATSDINDLIRDVSEIAANDVMESGEITNSVFGFEATTLDDEELNKNPAVKELRQSNVIGHLMRRVTSSSASLQLYQFGRNRLVQSLVLGDGMRFGKPVIFWRTSRTASRITPEECFSPYITTSNRQKRIINVLGISYENIYLMDPTMTLTSIMRRFPYSCPAHVTGEDLMKVITTTSMIDMEIVLEYLGFGYDAVLSIMASAEKLKFSSEMCDLRAASYYAGPMMYFNLSSSKINECTLSSNLSAYLDSDMRLFAMLNVVRDIYNGREPRVIHVQ
jgi:RNA-directed RNA polymerase